MIIFRKESNLNVIRYVIYNGAMLVSVIDFFMNFIFHESIFELGLSSQLETNETSNRLNNKQNRH